MAGGFDNEVRVCESADHEWSTSVSWRVVGLGDVLGVGSWIPFVEVV